jgi:ADP-heptose:LPS heptosyltransferase
MPRGILSFDKAAPHNILFLKGHSAGIGDLLRSSAAWRAVHNRFPDAKLNVWFLTGDPGSASEKLMAQHHLLTTFRVSDKRIEVKGVWRRLVSGARGVAAEIRPDLVIDCEPNGFRTTLLTWFLGRWSGGRTVGIAQVPGRGWFYGCSSPSVRAYASKHGLPLPLEYAERDFVSLAALGIERNGTAIELREGPEARAFRLQLRSRLGSESERPLLGLNIGCGTPDALSKRPSLELLLRLVQELQARHAFKLVLTGAPYEEDVNAQFRSLLGTAEALDLAGETSLVELAGVISVCRLFISSDSGPYHMAVGLRVPTLALFPQPNPAHYHHHDWVECQVAPGVESLSSLLAAAERLLKVKPKWPAGLPA